MCVGLKKLFIFKFYCVCVCGGGRLNLILVIKMTFILLFKDLKREQNETNKTNISPSEHFPALLYTFIV